MPFRYQHNCVRGWIFSTTLVIASCAADTATPAESDGTAASIDVAERSYELAAGDESRALGISLWAVEGDSFRGLDAKHQRITEIRVDHSAAVIESVYPDKGVRGIRDLRLNTLSNRSQQHLNALRSDLARAAAAADSAHMSSATLDSNVEKAQWVFIDCYNQQIDCIAVGQQLLFNEPPIISVYDCTVQAYCPSNYPHGLSVLTIN